MKFDKQGHRGCRGLMPENTIPAFVKALELGVTTLELDVVITKDKKVLISHEAYFNHEISTKPNGTFVNKQEEKQYNIYFMDYAETLKYDVGMKPHPRFPDQQKMAVRKPLLSDMIDTVESQVIKTNQTAVYYNIETKCLPHTDGLFHPKPEEFVDLLMAVIKEKKIEDRVIVQSFDKRTLKLLKQHYSGIKLALLYEPEEKAKGIDQQIEELGFVPDIYSPIYTSVGNALVEECKKKNIRLIPWTINSIVDMQRMIKLGVDGMISDYPNLFAQIA